jgi:hypothetical protein
VRSPGAERLGRVEFVVESGRSDARETWLVMRADPAAVLDRGVPAPNFPAGFNPYFDPPIAA